MFGPFNIPFPGREEPSPYVKATPLSLRPSGGIFREVWFLSGVILKFFDNKEFFKGIPRRTWSISDSSGAGSPENHLRSQTSNMGKSEEDGKRGKDWTSRLLPAPSFSAPPSAHRDLVARPNWTFVSSCLVSLLLILFISHRQELCCNQAVVSSLGQPAGAPARPLTRENLWPVLQGSLLSVSSNLKSCSSSWNRPLKAVPTSSPRLLPVRSADC